MRQDGTGQAFDVFRNDEVAPVFVAVMNGAVRYDQAATPRARMSPAKVDVPVPMTAKFVVVEFVFVELNTVSPVVMVMFDAGKILSVKLPVAAGRRPSPNAMNWRFTSSPMRCVPAEASSVTNAR